MWEEDTLPSGSEVGNWETDILPLDGVEHSTDAMASHVHALDALGVTKNQLDLNKPRAPHTINLPIHERLVAMHAARLCFNCLGTGHNLEN